MKVLVKPIIEDQKQNVEAYCESGYSCGFFSEKCDSGYSCGFFSEESDSESDDEILF